MSAAPAERSRARSTAVWLFVAVLAASAAAVTLAVRGSGGLTPGRSAPAVLPVLGALLIIAEYLFVRFRFGGETNALNLVEAVLAPMLFAFPVEQVVLTVAAAHLVGGLLRRNDPVKAAFNVAQWSLAAAVGSAVIAELVREPGISIQNGMALVAALGGVAIVNQTAFVAVLAIANAQRPSALLRGLAPVMVPGWLVGWVLNSAVGVLFVLAYEGHPGAVVLFAIPLAVLHVAYRGYAGARSDRIRLAGLHRAAQVLAQPLDPRGAIAPFLREVLRSFEARAAALVLREGEARHVHRVDADGTYVVETERDDASLYARALEAGEPIRVTRDSATPIGRALTDAGYREALCAPLTDEADVEGALLVLDQAGLEGFEEGELAVFDALARETASTLAKGRLLHATLEERRKLAEIVSTTSDGIMTIGADGTVHSWNQAMERITGVAATAVVGRADALSLLRPRTADGRPVTALRWDAAALPPELRIVATDGNERLLSCSYSVAQSPANGEHTLVVIARDVTTMHEMEQLRREFGRLARMEAAQRVVVDRLQEAVMPAKPNVPMTELGMSYMASDPTAPTGGDLYDWQMLASGELHLSVVDVLGHGVAATKDALAVVHALRLLAIEGCPLQEMVSRADRLIGAQNPELVATVIVGRYDPSSGCMRLAGGGHPPPMLLSQKNGVREIDVPGGAIGWPGAGSRAIAEVALEPGDSLLFYTDGLVEATKDIIEGTDSLVRHATEVMHLPATAMATGLAERALSSGDRRDDSLALVLRRAPTVRRAAWSIEPKPDEAHRVRRSVARWLHEQSIAAEIVDDLELVVSELVANAVKAARSAVQIGVTLEAASITIEVSDDGRGSRGIERAGQDLPAAELDAGRGLFIVRALADEVTISSTSAGTTVNFARSLRQPAVATPAALETGADERLSADA